MTGYVKVFKHAQGLGWIRPDDGSPDAFVHYSDISTEAVDKQLALAQRVAYDPEMTEKGPRARNVRITSPAPVAQQAEGVVTSVDWGYGFIARRGFESMTRDIFFDFQQVQSDFRGQAKLKVGDKVIVHYISTPRGRRATIVKSLPGVRVPVLSAVNSAKTGSSS